MIIRQIQSSESDQIHGLIAQRDMKQGEIIRSMNRFGVVLADAKKGEKLTVMKRGAVSMLADYYGVPVGWSGPLLASFVEFFFDGTEVFRINPFDFANGVTIGTIEHFDTSGEFARFVLSMGDAGGEAIDEYARQLAQSALNQFPIPTASLQPKYQFYIEPGETRRVAWEGGGTGLGGIEIVDVDGEEDVGLRVHKSGLYLMSFAPRVYGAPMDLTISTKYASSLANYVFIGKLNGVKQVDGDWPRMWQTRLVDVDYFPVDGDPNRYDLVFEVTNNAATQITLDNSPMLGIGLVGT